MSRFHGPYPGYKSDRGPIRRKGPKGIMKMDRALKREEAEKRQAAYAKKVAEANDESGREDGDVAG